MEAHQTSTFRPGSICTYNQSKARLTTAVRELNRHLAIFSLLDLLDLLYPLDLVLGNRAQEHQSEISAVDLRSVRVPVVTMPQLHVAVHVGYDQRDVVASMVSAQHVGSMGSLIKGGQHTELSS
jgi:hypothetical protein